MTNKNSKLPESAKSYWLDSVELARFPQLKENINVDVVIVGAGITGLTAAYLLIKEGLQVAIIEADRILHGTTGHTTGKVTAQHGLIYNELIKNTSINKARLYYEANDEALQFIEATIKQNEINCDFHKQDAYIFATTDKYRKKLEQEADAYKKIGINGKLVKKIPFPIDIKNALLMSNQAQFHPLKYLKSLVEILVNNGTQIYENTVAVNLDKADQPIVLTRENYQITANKVLICTHFPFYEGSGLYSTRLYASRSYALVAMKKDQYPGGMYVSVDKPTHSIRSINVNGAEYTLIVGEDHITGRGHDTATYYNSLLTFGEQFLNIANVEYRWSAQDLVTLDKIPYIGPITNREPNILIATGYRKWGLTNGTAAALLMKDLVLNKQNRFEQLFSPTRFYANPSIKNFLTQNAEVVGQLLKGKLKIPTKTIADLNTNEGSIVIINGKRKGAYRDNDRNIHLVDPTCTHIGCEVEWNSGENTWDCPCHGSRFSYSGEVIEGPAEKGLQKYDYTMLDNFTSEDSGY